MISEIFWIYIIWLKPNELRMAEITHSSFIGLDKQNF